MGIKGFLGELIAAIEALDSLDSNASQAAKALSRLTPLLCGFGEVCADVRVNQIPNMKEAQASKPEIDRMGEESYSRPRDLLALFGEFSPLSNSVDCWVSLIGLVMMLLR